MHSKTVSPLPHSTRVILLGGTSHTGKSTLGQALAARLGWIHLSTDNLARHPGRPWRSGLKSLPEHVATHYASLSVRELLSDVLRHYCEVVSPLIAELILRHAHDPSANRLVLEGSAVLPSLFEDTRCASVSALWLVAKRDLLTERIHRESDYDSRLGSEKLLIDQFRRRTWAFQDHLIEQTTRSGLRVLDSGPSSSWADFVEIALTRLATAGSLRGSNELERAGYGSH